jgi:TetR/AcrR family transcriptional repressor of bet genes
MVQMSRASNTEQRRREIAGGLTRVMAEKGYDGATISDVARASGLSAGLIHYHFESKQEILLAVLDDLVAAHREALRAALSRAGGDAISEVAAWLDFHLGLGARQDPEALACWVAMSAEAIRQPEVRRAYEAKVQLLAGDLAEIIRRGVSEWRFGCGDPEAAAAALLAAVSGYFTLAATARAVIPPGSAAAAAAAMAEGLLRPTRPLSRPE